MGAIPDEARVRVAEAKADPSGLGMGIRSALAEARRVGLAEVLCSRRPLPRDRGERVRAGRGASAVQPLPSRFLRSGSARGDGILYPFPFSSAFASAAAWYASASGTTIAFNGSSFSAMRDCASSLSRSASDVPSPPQACRRPQALSSALARAKGPKPLVAGSAPQPLSIGCGIIEATPNRTGLRPNASSTARIHRASCECDLVPRRARRDARRSLAQEALVSSHFRNESLAAAWHGSSANPVQRQAHLISHGIPRQRVRREPLTNASARAQAHTVCRL